MDGRLVVAGAFAFACTGFATTSSIAEPNTAVFETREPALETDRHAAAPPPCEPRLGFSRPVDGRRPAAPPQDPPAEFADRATPLSEGDAVADGPPRSVEYVQREQPCVAAPPEPAPVLDRTLALTAKAGEFETPEPTSFGIVLAAVVAFLTFRRLRR